jgi:anti-sigma regulatory factor (Ser/Thr protein kinase)
VPEVVDVDHSFDVDGLYALRATIAAHASHLGARPEQVEHLLIVASELASNAIRHGGGGGRLLLWQADNTLYCQVTDNGPGLADQTVGTTRPAHNSADGRGLWICRNLTAALTIELGPDGSGTTVTAAIPGPPVNVFGTGGRHPR